MSKLPFSLDCQTDSNKSLALPTTSSIGVSVETTVPCLPKTHASFLVSYRFVAKPGIYTSSPAMKWTTRTSNFLNFIYLVSIPHTATLRPILKHTPLYRSLQ